MSKRKSVLDDREISPPPIRRRLDSTSELTNTQTTTPPPRQIRIFSWNVNGVGPFLQKPISAFFTPPKNTSTNEAAQPPYSLRNFLRRHNWPNALCLQEVKINPKDEGTKRALERAANADSSTSSAGKKSGSGPGYTAFYCLPRDKYNAKGFGGKIYGVATFLRDDFLAESVIATREVEWDSEGRVLLTELKGGLVLINGYWVNGTTNPYRDSETGKVVGNRHDRKRRFHQLMLEECLRYEKSGLSVVLVGDMNVARCALDGYPGIRMGFEHVANRGNFNNLFFDSREGMKAVDAFRHLHGEEKKYTYYGRSHEWGESCDRVDLVMLSRKLAEEKRLIACDILSTPVERGHSDHVPLYVTVNMSTDEGTLDRINFV